MDLRTQILAAFLPEAGQNVEKLDHASEQYKAAKGIEETFTGGVAFLKALFPNVHVKTLATHIWDVFHHKHVVLALGPQVPTMSFAMVRRGGIPQALVLVPPNWLEMVKEDRALQLGAIVMVGSQAVDFYNGKFAKVEDIPTAERRCKAFEAEYLRTLPNHDLFNSYQTKLLKDYPSFPTELFYDYRPVEAQN